MRLTLPKRGGGTFGNLAKVRGIITYKISPYEQKAFANFWTKLVPNTFRRFKENSYLLIWPAAGYFLYNWIEGLNKSYSKKKPGEFDCDK